MAALHIKSMVLSGALANVLILATEVRRSGLFRRRLDTKKAARLTTNRSEIVGLNRSEFPLFNLFFNVELIRCQAKRR